MIIGITGKLQSGKTTTANFIKDIHGENNTIIIAFADLLKEMILKAGLCTKEELWGKKTEFSRMMMQKIGTEIIRDQVDPNFWIKKMDEKVKEILEKDINKLIIIHDVRFTNEANFVIENNGIIIRIERTILDQLNEIVGNHRSETEMDNIKVDIIIRNNQTLEDLRELVLKFMTYTVTKDREPYIYEAKRK